MHLAAAAAFAALLVEVEGPPAPSSAACLVPAQLLVKFDAGTSKQAIRQSLAAVAARRAGTVPGVGVEVVEVEPEREEVVSALLGADPPLVSGVAALALSLLPAATKGVVDRALERSAEPLAEPGVRYGQVDALQALVALEETFRPAEASSSPAPPPAAAPPASAPPGSPSSPPAVKPRAVVPAAVRTLTVAGRARVGHTLRARRGGWSGTTPLAFSYRWYRCRSLRSGCTPIRRARGLRYRVVRRDRGLRIRFSVTARNAAGVGFKISKPTARVRR
jgi:fervidolysin-like protein